MNNNEIIHNHIESLPAARIIKAVGGQYWLDDNKGFAGIATARGIFRKEKITPTPGDLVHYESSADPDIPWRIIDILPRANLLVRPPLANLDLLLITVAATEPEIDYHLVDKLIAACMVNKIHPVLIITKTDLYTGDPDNLLAAYRHAGFEVFTTNIADVDSHDKIRGLLPGSLVSFAGQSGVGKSTLLNQLFGSEKMDTGAISEKIGRGRHTTRHVELFPFAGGYLADTPGFSTLDLIELGLASDTIVKGYPEIDSLSDQCRFSGCRHLGDLGCAVDDAKIDTGRLERYRYFREQLDAIKPYEINQKDNSRPIERRRRRY